MQNSQESTQCSSGILSSLMLCDNGLINQILHGAPSSFKPGDKLIKAGDKFQGIFCIKSGFVKISKKSQKGKELFVTIEGPGDLIGLDSYNNDSGSLFNATSISTVTSCFIPGEEIKSLLNNHPLFAVALMKWMCDKISIMEKQYTLNVKKSVQTRFIDLLLLLQSKDPDYNQEKRYTIKEMAGLLGVSNNHLYKITTKLCNRGAIEIVNHKLKVHNAETLQTVANEK